MMKATLLLLVALAVSANGLGFPNFNLGCPFQQANRFTDGNTVGVIPYCRVANSANGLTFPGDFASQLVARPGYTAVYEPASAFVIIQPAVSFATLMAAVPAGDIPTAFPGTLVSAGELATEMLNANSMISTGNTVGFLMQGPGGNCNTFGTGDASFIAGITVTGLGLTTLVACPSANIIGHYEYANQAGGSYEGRAQELTLPRPYVFYGL
jgi:hypothetical protein